MTRLLANIAFAGLGIVLFVGLAIAAGFDKSKWISQKHGCLHG
jgi:hypothetical protein